VPLAKEFKGLGKWTSRLKREWMLGSRSALTLLVLWIGADDQDPTMATDNATFVAHPLY
jgi:hypothetical protein